LSSPDQAHWERITEDLVTLKDTSEMMIDLAYSALLLNSIFLAEEVERGRAVKQVPFTPVGSSASLPTPGR